MKARNPTKAERALLIGRPRLSPFPRPRTIVAIVRDKDERINVDRFRGISIFSPQSVRLQRLGVYVQELALQWAAYEAGYDPYLATKMADAFREIKSKETSETKSKNASNLRLKNTRDGTPISGATLEKFRLDFENHPSRSSDWGWKAAACRKLVIDIGTLNRRWTKKED